VRSRKTLVLEEDSYDQPLYPPPLHSPLPWALPGRPCFMVLAHQQQLPQPCHTRETVARVDIGWPGMWQKAQQCPPLSQEALLIGIRIL
jgi:hypothetical protein